MAETDEQAPANVPVAAAPEPKRATLTWLLGVGLAAAIGVALYLAWPDITGRRGEPSPVPPTEAPPPPSAPVPAEAPSAAPEPAPAEPAAAPSSDAALAALRARLEALEQAAAQRASPSQAADAAIAEQLTEFATRLDSIERRPVGDVEGSVARDAELSARLAAMESRLAAAEAAGADAAALRSALATTQAEAGALTTRLAALEHQSADDVRLIALVAAKAALAAASREGEALAHQLSDLRALLADSEPIAAPLEEIGRFADHGALGYEALRARFPALTREIVRASAKPDADAGWVDQTIARLGNIVTVRKTGGALEPGSLDERLVRAERALAELNGAAALDALDTLKGGEALEAYRGELTRRIALDEAVRAVDRHVTGLIAARIVPASVR